MIVITRPPYIQILALPLEAKADDDRIYHRGEVPRSRDVGRVFGAIEYDGGVERIQEFHRLWRNCIDRATREILGPSMA